MTQQPDAVDFFSSPRERRPRPVPPPFPEMVRQFTAPPDSPVPRMAPVPRPPQPRVERGTATLDSVSLRDVVLRPAALQARPMRRRPRGAGSIRPDVRVAVLLIGAAVGGVALLVLFWMDTPGLSFANAGEAFTSTGDGLGMLAAYLLMLQVLMMARVPWLERGIGSDRLAAAHRRMGEWVVLVLLAHVGTIVVGYANGVWSAVPGEVGTLVLHTAYVGLATVGTGFFLFIGVISFRAIRRRLPYEFWYYVHVSVYAALALAFAHQIVLGPTFSGSATTARWAWGAAYVAVGVAVIVFRVGGPLRLAVRHGLYVAAVKVEGPGTVSIYLGGRNLRRLGAQPGQFFRWRFLARGFWWQTHPFSLSAAPNREWLRVTVGALGDHTRELQKLKVGTRVLAEGPYGAFTAALRTRRKVLLFAGGIGITPLRALADALASTVTDIVLIYRAADMGEVVFARELEWMQRNGRLTVHYLLGKRDAQPRPLSAERLKDLVPDVADRDVFLCGPPGMVDAARQALRRAGVNRRRLHHERFVF